MSQRTNSQLPGKIFDFSYQYNLRGDLIEETYPTGRVVKNALNSAGNLARVSSNPAGQVEHIYANSFNYNAAGRVESLRLGNDLFESTQFNSRSQPIQMGLGHSETDTGLWKLSYQYGELQSNGNVDSSKNNGDIAKQTLVVPAVGSNQSFTAVTSHTYDSLNRLKTATEKISTTETWKQTYLYDRYGNRTFDATNTTTINQQLPASVTNPNVDSATNRLSSAQNYQYDQAGNMTGDAEGKRFAYDGENKQKQFFASSNGTSTPDATYYFDGDGKRIKKITASETLIFIYDAGGKLVTESSTIAPPSPSAAQINYMSNDHLGSTRVISNKVGSVNSRRDFMPYGEEISGTAGRSGNSQYTSDSIRQKFTGYEKDFESGLDFAQARMYSNSFGRFTSTDPVASKPINPQSHNKYAYVQNNPLMFSDPEGKELYINGEYADEMVAALSELTGYSLLRDPKTGKVTIDKTKKKKTGKGISEKLAANLNNAVNNLKDKNGKDVSFEFKATKDAYGSAKIWVDSFKSGEVDMKDMKDLKLFQPEFAAGQYAHILGEYSAAAIQAANEGKKIGDLVDALDNPLTHSEGNKQEGAVVGELLNKQLPERTGGAANPEDNYVSYRYGNIYYTIQWQSTRQNGKQVVFRNLASITPGENK